MFSMFEFPWANTDPKVPASITIQRPARFASNNSGSTDECTLASSAASVCSLGGADELQALNTILCVLVSFNADVQEIQSFLAAHPRALLLEGVGSVPEESAQYIVKQLMKGCQCFSPMCKQNRLLVLAALDRGFAHYEAARWEKNHRPYIDRFDLDQLVQLEGQIRTWRTEELTLRFRLLEIASEVRLHKGDLDKMNLQSRRALLLCTARSDTFARRSDLEYRVGLAELNLTSVSREHGALLQQIWHGRQEQFGLLTKALGERRRHVCTPHPRKQSGM
jgi:hypothetical protein